jgi:hypothetical protein
MKPEQQALLRVVLGRHQPSLLSIVDSLGTTPLTSEQREELRHALVDEMCQVGLEKNGEPNELGRRLDDLIGLLAQF